MRKNTKSSSKSESPRRLGGNGEGPPLCQEGLRLSFVAEYNNAAINSAFAPILKHYRTLCELRDKLMTPQKTVKPKTDEEITKEKAEKAAADAKNRDKNKDKENESSSDEGDDKIGPVNDAAWAKVMTLYLDSLENMCIALHINPAPREHRNAMNVVSPRRRNSMGIEVDKLFDWRLLRIALRMAREPICISSATFCVSEVGMTSCSLLLFHFKNHLQEIIPFSKNLYDPERFRWALALFDECYSYLEGRLFGEVSILF